jgi:hypothetical protein
MLARWEQTITDEAGNRIDQPTVRVEREVAGLPLAVLKSDIDGASPLSNPFTPAAGVDPFFHTQGGFFKITITKGAYSKVLRYVALGTAAALDTPPLSDAGVWDSGTDYVPGQTVQHDGSSYWALVESTAVEPGVTSGWESSWSLLAQAGTDGAAVPTTGLEFPEQSSAPATPAAGTLLVYAKDDGKLYKKNSAGVESDIAPPVREVLTANRTYYVRTDGSDSNNGLANTSGGAFLTIQKAVDTAAGLDLGVYSVTIQVADGTYTGGIVAKSYVGAGPINILGNTTTPANVFLNVTSADAFVADAVLGKYTLRGFKLKTTTSGFTFAARSNSIVDFGELVFDSSASTYHLDIRKGAIVKAVGNWSVIAGAAYHFAVAEGSNFDCNSRTITLTGTPAFSNAFARCSDASLALAYGMTFSGSATGSRYSVANGGVINTLGGGASYFPGNAAGAGTNFGASPYGLYL